MIPDRRQHESEPVRSFELQKAVLFVGFSRPDTTRQVFEAIRQVAPPRLYIALDGPRKGRPEEAERCAEVKAIVSNVDWDCQVRTLFREQNQGCRQAVSEAITWFFEHEEDGIILEDDCLPHPDFFRFCQAMLDHYRDDPRVMHVSGINFQFGRQYGKASYYFSNYVHVWGWASWRRAWQYYDGEMSDVDSFKKDLRNIIGDRFAAAYWGYVLGKVKSRKIDTWDFQWWYSVLNQRGLSIIPQQNLVSNIGFGGGTNTVGNSVFSELPLKNIGPVTHPQAVLPEKAADKRYFYRWFFDCLINLLLRKAGLK